MTLQTIVLRYAAFAVIATVANLATQRAVLQLGNTSAYFAAALGAGGSEATAAWTRRARPRPRTRCPLRRISVFIARVSSFRRRRRPRRRISLLQHRHYAVRV